MFEVVSNEILAPNLHQMQVKAPRVAAARKAGQFVIVRSEKGEERIPLTIGDADVEAGTITLFIQAIGASTKKLIDIPVGGYMSDVAGPLGMPTEIEKWGRVACIGGGVGTAVLYPMAKALADAGNTVTTVIGGRAKPLIILADELSAFSDEVKITTEDGSLGRQGFVTAELEDMINDPERRPEAVFAVGPVPMMRAIAEQTRPHGIKTIVSLNPIMIDGTGMCGGCRVVINGESKFACVDGPEFDAHEVDFDILIDRLSMYKKEEAHECQLANVKGESEKLQKLTPKERMQIPRVVMPAQDAEERSHNFKEVNLGLTLEQAQREALRCLDCKHKPCVNGCPVQVSIPEFVTAVAAGDLPKAAKILQGDNALPAVCGRVCPQEEQCESKCIHAAKGESVAIGNLERFVADWALANADKVEKAAPAPETGKKVAVIGCGPAGLTAAGELRKKGHTVSILEALHDTGGVLRYGIPEFRLPKDIIDVEVAALVKQGVDIECNVIIGKTLTMAQLQDEFDAVFIGNGAGLPIMLNIPGENLKGVYAANEYLTRVNLMGAGQTENCHTPVIQGKKVAVIGAGNTAMDCVRTARRLGADKAMIVYRRTEAEMPARLEEIHHAKEEGVELVLLTSPLGVKADENGWCTALECQRMKLGEPDDSGRRRPMAIEGDVYDLEADVVINALGTQANPILTSAAPELELNKWGNIVADENGATNMPGVFAGGDIIRGGATVILAMGDGKRAAAAIDEYLAAK